MIPKAYPPPRSGRGGARVGVDVGATLAKLALLPGDGTRVLWLIPSSDLERVGDEITALCAAQVRLTGCGARRLAEKLGLSGPTAVEFEAWAAGARAILREEGAVAPDRFLLVSVGTGTSALLVDASGCERLGGTALGGGTVSGLARALIGSTDFDEVARLAREGDRRSVDLLLGDIYPAGESPLPEFMNAASFGKLAREAGALEPDRCDLAHAIMGLVGENVGLICGGLAARAGVDHIVYGGSTLRHNDALSDILRALAAACGCRATILKDGEFAGALGALAIDDGTGS